MDILMLIAATILAVMGLLFRRGSMIIKLREANLGKIARQNGKEPDIMEGAPTMEDFHKFQSLRN